MIRKSKFKESYFISFLLLPTVVVLLDTTRYNHRHSRRLKCCDSQGQGFL